MPLPYPAPSQVVHLAVTMPGPAHVARLPLGRVVLGEGMEHDRLVCGRSRVRQQQLRLRLPCQFEQRPNQGHCHGFEVVRIDKGCGRPMENLAHSGSVTGTE